MDQPIEFDTQRQFIVSMCRLGGTMLSLGGAWLLWNSTLLTERRRNAAIIAGMIHCLFAVIVDLAQVHAGLFKYAITVNTYQGVPLDIHIVYGALWGTLFCLLWENASTLMRFLLFGAAIVLAVMRNRWGLSAGYIYASATPSWPAWDIVVQSSLTFIAINFYRLIDENRALILRSLVYAFGYFAFFYFLIPSVILSLSQGDAIFPPSEWQVAVVGVSFFSVPGAWAAGQFAFSGRGTPLPLDPTHKLIITGPYAYVRNPMQISCVGVAFIWAFTTKSLALWIYFAVIVIALQFTRIAEEDELHRRFGERYKKYCRRVWLWLPSFWAYEED